MRVCVGCVWCVWRGCVFVKKILELRHILKKNIYVCIPRSFLVMNVCNQGKTLCSPCVCVCVCVCVCMYARIYISHPTA